MRLSYLHDQPPPKHAVIALKRHYDEIIANQQNEIQLLRMELAAYGHPYYQCAQ